jgi:hypothetical protein
MNKKKYLSISWIHSLAQMKKRKYWNKENSVEFAAFVIKAVIIIPGLLFDFQVWWLYLFALFSSAMLIWSSTIKTLPTLIWFNILWILLSIVAIIKNFNG